MNMIKKFLFPSLVVCAVITLIRGLFARRSATPALEKPAPSKTSFDTIDDYVEQQMHRLNIPGVSLAIVEGDQIVHQRGFGKARPGGEAPAPQTLFPIGSLTKSFTALAVMQLVKAGKIDPDAPIQRYLPWFRVADPQASAQMTVRHLLNQTSGLPTWTGEIPLADFDNRPGAAERQARALSTLKLTRPVGLEFEYSNSNYILLGLVIEAACGESYADYIQNHIFNPLGMSHSYTSQALAKQNGMAMGHQQWFVIPFAAPDIPIPQVALACGGLISNVEDLARYMIAHLNGGRCENAQILSAAGIDELHHGVPDINAMGIRVGQYGMGWLVDETGVTKLVWHDGTLPDFGAFMAFLPGQKKGLVLLFNACHHWFNPIMKDVGLGAAALLAGEQPSPILLFRMYPWMLRGQLLIPALQIAGVAATLRMLRRWRLHPELRPSGGRKWVSNILLPLIPNLLVALSLVPLLGKRRRYLMYYMPDFSLIAMVCGSFSLVWTFLRTGLILKTLRKPHL